MKKQSFPKEKLNITSNQQISHVMPIPMFLLRKHSEKTH